MSRYFLTLKRSWSAAVQAEMEYRINFVLSSLHSVGTLVGAIFTLSLFYRDGYEMGGWTWPQVLMVIGFYTFLDGVQNTVFMPNYQRITENVREGTLDFILLKPIDSQFMVSFRSISVWGLPNVVSGLAIVGYAGSLHDPALPWHAFVYAVLPLLVAVVVLYSIGMLLATLTIWFVKLWNLTMALQSVLQAGRYPVPAYPFGYRIFFTFVIPVAFLTTVPARAMIGKDDGRWVAGALLLSLVLVIASRAFWRFALRFYTSASS